MTHTGNKTRTTPRAAALLAAGLLALPLATAGSAARADDMMDVCKAEIASTCGDIKEGRGRIFACLYAHGDTLSGGCRTEVDAISRTSTAQRLLPTDAESSRQQASLKTACASDIDRVCTGVREGEGRLLACVYARSNKVSASCEAAAKTFMQ